MSRISDVLKNIKSNLCREIHLDLQTANSFHFIFRKGINRSETTPAGSANKIDKVK